jgi:hypothetical protein
LSMLGMCGFGFGMFANNQNVCQVLVLWGFTNIGKVCHVVVLPGYANIGKVCHVVVLPGFANIGKVCMFWFCQVFPWPQRHASFCFARFCQYSGVKKKKFAFQIREVGGLTTIQKRT